MPPRPAPPEPKQDRSHATRRRLLDAAVDELVEHGYAKLTTSGVAHRAGVSRGAQQHHFPHKEVLIAEAVSQLAERQLGELREQVARARSERARVERALDTVFAQYGGRLFAAMVDLSLAARDEPELRALLANEERAIGRTMVAWAAEVFAPEVVAAKGFEGRWAMALSTVRGLAMLKLLGHPPAAIAQQWRFTRRELVRLLLADAGAVPPAPAGAPRRA